MALNKKICERCWNKAGKEIYRWKVGGWQEYDEDQWKDGYIECPSEYVELGNYNTRKITDEPPSKCPFILEHII